MHCQVQSRPANSQGMRAGRTIQRLGMPGGWGMLGVVLGCFLRVVLGLHMMAMSQMCLMPGLLVVARLVVLGGSQMILGSMLMMFCCLTMMFSGFFRHGLILASKRSKYPMVFSFRG
jgi:hypothetical protein